eukprot:scaffold340_cov177-Ochromonas_danica.AAC.9
MIDDVMKVKQEEQRQQRSAAIWNSSNFFQKGYYEKERSRLQKREGRKEGIVLFRRFRMKDD